MIEDSIIRLFNKVMQENGIKSHSIENVSYVGGGDINNSIKIETMKGKYFLKYNDADLYPEMFEKEAKGLNLLKSSGQINVPNVIGYAEDEKNSILVLEYIESSLQSSSFFKDFGQSLAKMHNCSGNSFGLDHDNYIGNLKQSNKTHDNWIDFFVCERLEKQISLAKNNNLIDNTTIKKFQNLYNYLNDFFPIEKPSLLHGDLWSGNFMISSDGKACIIDPAVYYGHRLMDLGMSKLFGGFDKSFYDAYNEIYELENNWLEAIEICNLYPLMVHVNIFGAGYLNSVKSILRSF